MKVPANVSGDKLILDYLARVTQAGLRYLPKGARLEFVGRTKALIERECGPAVLADPARVMEVLAGIGDPEEIVRAERARIDAEWARRRAGGREAGEAAAAAITQPLAHRPLTARWKPATDAPRPSLLGPLSRYTRSGEPGGTEAPGTGGQGAKPGEAGGGETDSGSGGQAVSGSGGPAVPRDEAGAGGRTVQLPGPQQPVVSEGQAGELRGSPGQAGEGRAWLPRPRGSAGSGWATQVPGPARSPEAGEPGPAGPGPAGDGPAGAGAGETGPDGGRAGWPSRPSGEDLAVLARAIWRTTRGRPWEVACVVVLGIGGLILPFPFWLLGGLGAVMSRFFNVSDKWIAIGGPVLVALVGTLVTAVIVGGHANPVVIYIDALRLDVGWLLRAGSVLSAAYLARRIRQGPRERVPPWKRY